MYRLMKLRNTRLHNLQRLTTCASLIKVKPSVDSRICTLCNTINNFSNVYVRSQSTNTNPYIKQKKPRKKRAKHTKKYAELLVVTDESTMEQKTSLKKLNSNDLRILAQTNFNLREYFKLEACRKNRYVEEHTYNNLTIIGHIPSVADSILFHSEIVPETSIKPEESVLNSIVNNKLAINVNNVTLNESVVQSNQLCEIENACDIVENEELIVEDIQKPSPLGTFHPEMEELEHPEVTEPEDVQPSARQSPNIDYAAREEVVTKTLAAYVEICSHLKTPQRGLNAFYFHKHQARNSSRFYPHIKNISVFNALLKGFSVKGDFQKVKEVVKFMRDAEAEPNIETYAAIFGCLGQVNVKDSHLKQIRVFTKDMLKHGITFDQILSRATFFNDQRSLVLKAMKSYDPGYVPCLEIPNVQYSNEFLDHLNHSDQFKFKCVTKNSKSKNSEIFKKAPCKTLLQEQLDMEKEGYVTVKSIEARPDPTEEVIKYRQVLDEHLKLWETTASEAFDRDLSTLTARRSALNLEPYMRCLPSKDFVKIIVDEAVKLAQGSETFSPTVNQLYRDMGRKVYAKYKVLKKQKTGVLDKIIKIHTDYCSDYVLEHGKLDVLPKLVSNVNSRQRWQWTERLYKNDGASITMDHQEWVPTVLQAIGKFLYHIVMHDMKIDVNSMRINSTHKNYLPAFYSVFRTQGRLIKEEVKPHPVLSRLYRASMPETLTFPAYELPMRCPPVPWTSVYSGGYLVAPCDMVRLPSQAATQKQRLDEVEPSELYPSLDSLNQLAAVPWKVNKTILNVILEVFNSGGSAKLDVPEPPSALPAPPSITPDMDKGQRYLNFRQRLQHRKKKAEMYSLWCDCLYRLSLANHFCDDVFWLPHNMDFRGRVYPVPPHLNHLGSDLARSMLVFAQSRPLGPNGLDWLKLHLVNLTGLKKREPVSERILFANEKMPEILDSADNPLTGKRWWAESEEPWQTLACCMEIAAAHRSSNPKAFRSHFPVHQDGSCNGLQHYAALGRDSAGAYSVNLTPSSIPQDVYSAVVTLVEQERVKDAEKGLEIAKVLEGFVKRKVIKQTIMTTVYGVTRFGARLQIARQLKDIDEFPKEHVWAASSYLTGRTFESLRTMFTSTREIQDWFTECARLISSVGGQNVEWVTPLGLPIVQPYNRYRKFNASMVYESFHMDKYEKPNVMKQKNAFPPNFIHSLDSSHMMLTSLHCERAGITFVSVHDCYWTHPSTVHIMNKICREQFVMLHSQPILENLSLFLSEKYSYGDDEFADDGSIVDLTKRKLNRALRRLPQTGEFDIKQVLRSVYFFS